MGQPTQGAHRGISRLTPVGTVQLEKFRTPPEQVRASQLSGTERKQRSDRENRSVLEAWNGSLWKKCG